jgi:CheY-like chemotaxis protein
MSDARKHVLIVEDNNAMLQLYSQVLSSAGFKVSTAIDGQAGWVMAQGERPDLILLDMVIPKLSGEELLRKLQENPETAKIPVVVFSSVNSADKVQQMFAAGASDFLSKATSSPKQVVSKVQSVLDKAAPAASATPRLCPHCHKPI